MTHLRYGGRRLRSERPTLHLVGEPERQLAPEETEDPFVRWVQVLKIGQQFTNRYAKPYVLDDEGAARVVETFDRLTGLGFDTIFDLNHYSSEGGPTPEHEARTGTMQRLDHRLGEGVWALTEFLDDAKALIQAGKFRLVSPELWPRVKDPESGEWIEGPVLAAAALVERPALGAMEKIAARDVPPGVAAALADRFGAADVMAATGKVVARFDALAIQGVFGPVEIHEDGTGDGWQCDVCIDRIDPDFESLRATNTRTGTTYEADIADENGDVVIRNIRAGTLAFVPDPVQQEEQQMRFQDHEAAEAALLALEQQLGIGEDEGQRTAADVVEALKLADKPPAEDDGDDLRGAVTLLREKAEKAEARTAEIEAEAKLLRDKVEAAEAEKADRAARSLVDAAEAEGKITPATREFYVGLAKQDAEAFKAHAAAMPVVVNLREQGTGDAPPPADGPGDGLNDLVEAKAKELAEAAGKGAAHYLDHYEEALSAVRSTPDGEAVYRSHFNQG